MRALILAAAILLCAPVAASAPGRSGPVPAAAPAPEILKLAAGVQRTGPRLARLWPGFWPADQAFIIYRPGSGALLVSAAAGPPGFAPLAAAGLPKPLRGRARFRAGDLDAVRRPFILGYPIGEGQMAVLVLAEDEAKDLATLIFHEQFHDYQRRAFKHRASSQFVAPRAVPNRVSFAAAAETERRILAAALASKPGRARHGLLHQYLALRREREKGLAPGVIGVERQFEKIEGTAKFIDRAAVALGPGRDGDLPGLIAKVLGEDLGAGGQPFLTAWFRSRSYGVGAALTYFVRELDPKHWQAAVEGTEPLDERLAELTGFAAVRDPAGLAQTARSAFGYAATRAALEPAIRAAERKEIKSSEEFHALGAYRVVVEIKAAPGGDRGVEMGFATGPGGMTLLGEAHLVLPDPRMVDIKLANASLTVRGRPFMSESSKTNRYTILIPSAPSVNGRSGLAAGEHELARLDLTADGLELKVERPVTVTVSPSETIVSIR
ncbi:MAG TPA: hypothetical protein VK403_12380 [Allosphingosinicella sp.]|nr:hypothetical protein [Allosphingosinicella sp.]